MMKIRRLCVFAGLCFFSAFSLPAPTYAQSYGGVETYSVTYYDDFSHQVIGGSSGTILSSLSVDLGGSMSIGDFNVEGTIELGEYSSNPFSASGSISSGYMPNGTAYGNFAVSDTSAVADISIQEYTPNYTSFEQAFVTFQTVPPAPEPSSIVLGVLGGLIASIFMWTRRIFAR